MSRQKKADQKKKRRLTKQQQARLANGNAIFHKDGSKSIPLTPQLVDIAKGQIERFRQKFGREPEDDDPLFFDPNADTPQPMSEEAIEELRLTTTRLLLETGARPEVVFAQWATERIVTAQNRKFLTASEQEEWDAAVAEYRKGRTARVAKFRKDFDVPEHGGSSPLVADLDASKLADDTDEAEDAEAEAEEELQPRTLELIEARIQQAKNDAFPEGEEAVLGVGAVPYNAALVLGFGLARASLFPSQLEQRTFFTLSVLQAIRHFTRFVNRDNTSWTGLKELLRMVNTESSRVAKLTLDCVRQSAGKDMFDVYFRRPDKFPAYRPDLRFCTPVDGDTLVPQIFVDLRPPEGLGAVERGIYEDVHSMFGRTFPQLDSVPEEKKQETAVHNMISGLLYYLTLGKCVLTSWSPKEQQFLDQMACLTVDRALYDPSGSVVRPGELLRFPSSRRI